MKMRQERSKLHTVMAAFAAMTVSFSSLVTHLPQAGRDYSSCATLLRSTPIPLTSTSTVSPCFIQSGGLR